MKKINTAVSRALLIPAFVALILVVAFGQSRTTKDNVWQARREFNWPVFLSVMEKADAPTSGILAIPRLELKAVNNHYGTAFRETEVKADRGLSRWCCILYLRLRNADGDYKKASMALDIGIERMSPVEARIHWEDTIQPALAKQNVLRR